MRVLRAEVENVEKGVADPFAKVAFAQCYFVALAQGACVMQELDFGIQSAR